MTSPPEQITVECPECGHVYEDWQRASINLDLDPALADPEYLDEASSATCPECGHKVDLGTLTVEGNLWRVG